MGIRFPLSGEATALAHEVQFWLDLTARRLGRPLERACYFWTAAGAESSDLYLFFSEPSGPQWTCLADPDANIETVSFLDRPYGSEPERRMEPALRSLADTSDARLADYLAWAGRSVLS